MTVPVSPSPLVELQLETAAFAQDWNHCDQIANYLAQLVAHDRADSFLYANLLSTVLNELLEVVFAHHQPRGLVKCALLRRGASDRLELTIPVDDEARAFYQRSVVAAGGPSVSDVYTRTLLGKEPPAGSLGFLELAADYGARLTLEATASAEEIRLALEVTLEDGGLPATRTV